MTYDACHGTEYDVIHLIWISYDYMILTPTPTPNAYTPKPAIKIKNLLTDYLESDADADAAILLDDPRWEI
eukprot:scaffold274507_cov44-Tisochrysis_lutea.AAC.1